MAHIFLSYSRGDIDKAKRIAAALERNGLSVWWDRTISPGETFDQVIETALDDSSWTVVLWSSTSIASNWVKAESEESLRNNKLVPVLIEDVRPPLAFRRIEAAELQNWNGDDNDDEFRQLLTVLGGTPAPAIRKPAAQKSTQSNNFSQSAPAAKMSLLRKTIVAFSALLVLALLANAFFNGMIDDDYGADAHIQDNVGTSQLVVEAKPTPIRITEPPVTQNEPDTGTIILQYLGDEYACVLNVVIEIDGQTIVPTGNTEIVNGITLGSVPYSVSGTIACPTQGSCNAFGSGSLSARDGGKYNLIWQNTTFAQCDITFVAG